MCPVHVARTLAAAAFVAALPVLGFGVGPAASAQAAPALAPAGDHGAGGWRWPLAGRPTVLHGFDPPAKRWLPGHRGVDLATTPGAAVRAAGAGVIGYAGKLGGRGVVTVVHGALRTTYEPVDATVHHGDQVDAGQVIGHVEAAAGHCAPKACLHWGLLRGEKYLNPLSLVRTRIQLLPVWDVPKPYGGAARPAASPSHAPDPQRAADAPDALGPRSATGLGAGGVALVGGAVAAARRRRRPGIRRTPG